MDWNDDLTNFLEVKLADDEAFLKIKETLTRIGIASEKNKTLYQSCHILHKKHKYYLTHFKEMFILDGKRTDISDMDYARRNSIAALLQQWGLLTIINPKQIEGNMASLNKIKILPFREKDQWNLVVKYTIGKNKSASYTF